MNDLIVQRNLVSLPLFRPPLNDTGFDAIVVVFIVLVKFFFCIDKILCIKNQFTAHKHIGEKERKRARERQTEGKYEKCKQRLNFTVRSSDTNQSHQLCCLLRENNQSIFIRSNINTYFLLCTSSDKKSGYVQM